MTLDEVASAVEPGRFQRGVELYERGRVAGAGRLPDRLVAEVLDEEGRFAVEIDEPLRATCACGSAALCAHAAAVLVAWAKEPRLFRLLRRAPDRPAPEEPDLAALKLLDDWARRGLDSLAEEEILDLASALRGGRLANLAREFGRTRRVSLFADLVFAVRDRQAPRVRADLSLLALDSEHFVELRTGEIFEACEPRAGMRLDVREAREGPNGLDLVAFEERPAEPADFVAAAAHACSVRELVERYRLGMGPFALFRPAAFAPRAGWLYAIGEAGDALRLDCDDIPMRTLGRFIAEPSPLLVRLTFDEGEVLARPVSLIPDGSEPAAFTVRP